MERHQGQTWHPLLKAGLSTKRIAMDSPYGVPGGGGCLGPDVVSYFLTPGGLSGGEYRRASKQEILAWCPADSVR